MEVKFDVNKEDAAAIDKIVYRAFDRNNFLADALHQMQVDRLSLSMDITATHANGCPLDLQKLLDADEFNFTHDITGIYNNLDRTTGKLGNCFLPRCAR